jgi:aspartyl protease family protein
VFRVNRLLALLFGFAALGLFVPNLSERLLEPQKTSKVGSQNAGTQKAGELKANNISVGSGQVRLKPDARGHYVADFKMNGRVVTALVDTGASSVAINKSTARKLGLNVTANDFIHEATTANGKTKMAIATIREIQIGRILVRDVEAAVLEDKALDGTLLGMSFLRQLDGFTVTDGDLILKQ